MDVTVEMMMRWLQEFAADLSGILLSVIIVIVYYVIRHKRAQRNPDNSIIGVNKLARKLWVENVMSQPGLEIMAVQTLRNLIMVSIMLVSTAALLIIGTLTLSGQAENISRTWHVLNLVGSHSAELWIIKVLCLLADFLIAFFASAMSLRLATHVLFMVNVPERIRQAHEMLTPVHTARRLNQAGHMITISMRAFFFAIPLVFWLFGPVFLVLATLGIVIIFYRLNRF